MTIIDAEQAGRLEAWGWDESWAAAFAPYADGGMWPARVIAQHRGVWVVMGANGETTGSPTGKLRRGADDDAYPTVGDWVVCLESAHGGAAAIHATSVSYTHSDAADEEDSVDLG